MKNKKIKCLFFGLIFFNTFFVGNLFADNNTEDISKLDYSLKLQTDIALSPKNIVQSGGTHFSEIETLFGSFVGQETCFLDVTFPLYEGKNFLVKNVNINFSTNVQISPVTAKFTGEINFTPFPFLILNAGSHIGTGWAIGNNYGIGIYNYETKFYEALDFCNNWYYSYWFGGVFQFDLGAVIPGKWTHVVCQIKDLVNYVGMSGVEDGKLWMWQTNPNSVNGWMNYLFAVVGYQLPWNNMLIGINLETWNYLDKNAFGEYSSTFNNDFVETALSLICYFDITPKDTIYIVPCISSRRSFVENRENNDCEIELNYSGREWYFKRAAVRWIHKF